MTPPVCDSSWARVGAARHGASPLTYPPTGRSSAMAPLEAALRIAAAVNIFVAEPI